MVSKQLNYKGSMTFRIWVLLHLSILPFLGFAQNFKVSGVIKDANDSSSLIGVAVQLQNTADSTMKFGTITSENGIFELTNLPKGKYNLRAEYLGYRKYRQLITVEGNDVDLGIIKMTATTKELGGTTISGKQIRAEQNGDTTSFHADAYKTHPDATAEDLVNKMPGISSDNSGVKVNGESVQQVYVDGKPFFGNDPTLALRNLPAEVVDKIQVFDKLSDQAIFTGFDDGNSQKTLNITTKRNKSEGVFGKVYGGGGTDETYISGGNLNVFDGDRRISLLALANNINQQNFSTQDLLGVSGSGSGGRGSGGMGGFGGMGGGSGGGSGANNFLVNQQNGITTTNAAGFNFTDVWAKKVKLTGSYFYNGTDNNNISTINRNYFTGAETGNIYNEYDNTSTRNYNNRLNLRLEYTIDSFNTIIFTPSVSFQHTLNSDVQTDTIVAKAFQTTTVNNTGSDNTGYSSSNNLFLQHKFKKPRRTISLNINTNLNEKNAPGNLYTSNNEYATYAVMNSRNNQQYSLYNNSYTLGCNLNYTEPVGKKGQIMINYAPSFTNNLSDKASYDFDSTTKSYSDLNQNFSNKYTNTYITEKGGISYRKGNKKMNFSIGANLQYANLNGNQIFPYGSPINRTFTDVLPIAFFNYRFDDGRNLRIMYRTNIAAPSISQLQDVVDVSNPLLLSTGNPNLRQDYEQSIIIRYGLAKSKTAHNFFIYTYCNFISNYIGNASYQPTKDSLFQGPLANVPVKVNKGSQISLPVNLDGYVNFKSFVTYSVPADFIKSNLNFNGGFSFTNTPGVVNSVINYSGNYVPTGGIVLSSNISEKLDFTLSYTGNYNVVSNSLQSQSNNNYYSHTASFKINWIFLNRFVFNSNITHNYYTSFSSTGNQSYYLWVTYLGYKMLKKQSLEARLTGYDLLNQNKNVTRSVTGTYIENDITNVLKQYLRLQLTYTIRNFKGPLPAPPAEHGDSFMQWRGR
jgi:Outer membrane protein beta-barrel family/CarboxypepD_reg-like domain